MSRPYIPKIALVGRTNVGKSTLFNRLIEEQKALVSDIAGTTRDRKEGECVWRGKIVQIVDTGGLDVEYADEIEENIVRQAELAMEQADIILFVVDMQAGPLPQDYELAQQLKEGDKPVIVVGNKAESPKLRNTADDPEWHFSGLGTPSAVSALRGKGVGDLLDEVYDLLEEIGKEPASPAQVKAVHVSLIGKPNVGKSSLTNSIIGQERFITSPIAHTTREPIDTLVERDDKSYVLIDTAGMRKKRKVRKSGGLEKKGVERTERILKKTDVALFVMDISQKIGNQERTLAGLIKNHNVGCIMVANKWDLIPDKDPGTINEYEKYISQSIPFLKWAPIVFVSAKTTQRVAGIFDLIDEVEKNRLRKVDSEELDEFWRAAVKQHLPSRHKGPKHPTVMGMKQIGIAPPRFEVIIKAKQTDVLHQSYLRYLENRLREQFNFMGTPIQIDVSAARAVGSKT